MAVIKKNLFSIILGVIAILCVVAHFYPMGKKREELHAEAMKHASEAETLKTLSNKVHNLPVVVPGSTEAVPLQGFPTHQAVEAAQKATKDVSDAADLIMKKSADLNLHKPLVEGALPGVQGDLAGSKFARYYVATFPVPVPVGTGPGVVIPPPPAKLPNQGPTLMEILHAGVPPSQAEMDQSRADMTKKIQDDNTRIVQGNVVNKEEVDQLVQTGLKALAEEMRSATAKKCLVFVAPDAFAMYTGMIVSATPDPTSIFWAQIGLWAQEDVCKAIYETNSKSENVLVAPIKQVVKISFVVPGQSNSGGSTLSVIPVFVVPTLQPSGGVGNVTPTATGAPGAEGTATPSLVPAGDPNAPLTRNNILSPTGRQSNPLYDVVQFDVELIVDAGSVPQVLAGLGTKQYICVTQLLTLDPVDSAFYRGQGNYFGTKPCVKIKVRCEELFFRSWLAAYVPQSLKTVLGYPAPTTPPT